MESIAELSKSVMDFAKFVEFVSSLKTTKQLQALVDTGLWTQDDRFAEAIFIRWNEIKDAPGNQGSPFQGSPDFWGTVNDVFDLDKYEDLNQDGGAEADVDMEDEPQDQAPEPLDVEDEPLDPEEAPKPLDNFFLLTGPLTPLPDRWYSHFGSVVLPLAATT